jgi:DNA-binding transcriptional MerR regulator
VTDRSYLSISEVLSLLLDEFPDVTISKIRFLETRGLVDPERTPSGYRKFYDTDVDRLRWILRQQREHFLPLKVIKGRLEGGSPEDALPVAPSLFDPPEGAARAGSDDPPPGASEPALVGAGSASNSANEEAGVPKESSGRVARSDEAPRASAAAGTTGSVGATKPPGSQAGVPAAASTSRPEQDLAPGIAPRGEEQSRAAKQQRPPEAHALAPDASQASGDAAGSGASSPPGPARTEAAGQRPHQPAETPFGLPPRMTPASAAERERAAGDARIATQPRSVAGSTTAPAAAPTEPAAVPKPGPPTAGSPGSESAQEGSHTAPPAVSASANPAATAASRAAVAPAGPTRGAASQGGSVTSRAAGAAAALSGTSAVRESGGVAARSSLGSGVSLTLEELAEASGLSVAEVERLEEYGLIFGRPVAGVKCFDEDGLVVARLTAGFAKYGIEPRHLRSYMHAAEREAGLFSQVVMPLLRQRNPLARSRAGDSLAELTELGAGLHAAFVRIALRDLTGG